MVGLIAQPFSLNYAVSFTHSADVSFHEKPASQAIASKFALLCLAQLPAYRLDVVTIIAKMLADKIFIFHPFIESNHKCVSLTVCLKD